MVGEGVLLECLNNPRVGEVLAIGRRPLGRSHPKLREIIHADLFNLEPVAGQLEGYDACFFCLGISSVGVSQQEYKRITQDLTLDFAQLLAARNPELTFCYVSGAGTDGGERGRTTWARVKGATENALMRMFKRSYMFRPGFLKPSPGQRNVLRLYKLVGWMYPLGRTLYPAGFCTLQELGRAMINAAAIGYRKQILEVRDIVGLAAMDANEVEATTPPAR